MASLKEIRGRIGSVKGTLKITSAMRLISSAKLHSAQNAIGNMVPYEHHVQDIMMSLMRSGGFSDAMDRYLAEGENPRTYVVLVTSNQTLCGAFNVNLAKAFENLNLDREQTVVYAVGKYGLKHVQKLGYEAVDCCDIAAHADYDRSVELSNLFASHFLEGKVGRVKMVYAHFASPVSQPIVCEDYLPMSLDLGGVAAQEADENGFLTEPSAAELLEQMLPMVLRLKLHTVMLDSTAAEHAARTMAMQMASENAQDLISELSLQYNKLRQQAITSEILDLIGGQANNI